MRFVEDWNALSDADKASFADLAKRGKERYTAECAASSPHSFIEELAKPLNPKEAHEVPRAPSAIARALNRRPCPQRPPAVGSSACWARVPLSCAASRRAFWI